jgi:hypothetical protein
MHFCCFFVQDKYISKKSQSFPSSGSNCNKTIKRFSAVSYAGAAVNGIQQLSSIKSEPREAKPNSAILMQVVTSSVHPPTL